MIAALMSCLFIFGSLMDWISESALVKSKDCSYSALEDTNRQAKSEMIRNIVLGAIWLIFFLSFKKMILKLA